MPSESRVLDKARIIEWLRSRIKDLEEELEAMKALLDIVEKGGSVDSMLPGERSEDLKIGRRRIARLFKGETHVRISFEYPQILPEEVEAYLKNVEEELRSLQARTGGVVGEDLATLHVVRSTDGRVKELWFKGLYTTVEHLKAKAALKYAAETIHYISKAVDRE